MEMRSASQNGSEISHTEGVMHRKSDIHVSQVYDYAISELSGFEVIIS